METTITEVTQVEKKPIFYNVELMKWYFQQGKRILEDSEKQKIFSILSFSVLEEPYVFMRVMLYIANTRRSNEEEISYKILIHFLGTMFPEMCMANLDMFVSLGKKDDILYFMQCSNITQRIITYVNHKSKEDNEFKKLLEGTVIGTPIKRQVRYKPKLKRGHKWDVFLMKILDDPSFNGITL